MLNAGALQSSPLNKNFVPKFRLLTRRDKKNEFLLILIHSNSLLTRAWILVILCFICFSASFLDSYYPYVDLHLVFAKFCRFYYSFMFLESFISDFYHYTSFVALCQRSSSTSLYDLPICLLVHFPIIPRLARLYF